MTGDSKIVKLPRHTTKYMTETDSSNHKLESDAIALFDQDVNPEQCTLKPDARSN